MIAAQHIKDLRIKKNYSQSYLAYELGISQKTYSNVENGKTKINLELLTKLAAIYGIEVADFVTQITTSDSKTINAIIKSNKSITGAELYDGINRDLPYDYIHLLNARIKDLKELVKSKDLQIALLIDKITTLEQKAS